MRKSSAIEELHDVEFENFGEHGHKFRIIFKGKNKRGTFVRFTIEADMYFAGPIAAKCKKTVLNYAKRVEAVKSDFFNEINNT